MPPPRPPARDRRDDAAPGGGPRRLAARLSAGQLHRLTQQFQGLVRALVGQVDEVDEDVVDVRLVSRTEDDVRDPRHG
ncbi:hypothetical protein SLI_1244 [Streptomyces lividans 1326]|uniref:Uncharacterized protein n=1 Tax=Streptomyces lividans 1326 TaxID=1200984 RepID=A0A7U9DL50_STRLI|nr:hypothetical protein SLI_1244 [Streptomyces lividans 1326]